MKRLRDDRRGAVLIAVLVIIAVLAILANALARRQAYVWRLHRRIRKRECALNAARSGAELVLARVERGLPASTPVEAACGSGTFEAGLVEDTIVSRGRDSSEPGASEAVVTVRYRKTVRGIEIVHWEER